MGRPEVHPVRMPDPRYVLGLLVLALPAALFLPGVGIESTSPRALARSSGTSTIWTYRIQPGDSLTTIAERELGTFKRYKEILRLNPDVRPRALGVGDVLRMPRRAPGAAPPAAQAAPAPDTTRLLLSTAGLLTLVVLIVLVAGRLERRAWLRG